MVTLFIYCIALADYAFTCPFVRGILDNYSKQLPVAGVYHVRYTPKKVFVGVARAWAI